MAVSTTGSRNGIIAWAVVSSIVGVGSLIWAVISFTQANKATKDLADLTKKYNTIATSADLAGEDVAALTAIKADTSRDLGGYNLLPLARQQTLELTRFIGGPSASDDKTARALMQVAMDKAKTEAAAAAKPAEGDAATTAPVETAVRNSSVLEAFTDLAGNNDKLRKARADDMTALAAAAAALDASKKEQAQIVADQSSTIEKTISSAAEAQASAKTYADSQDAQSAASAKMAADAAEKGIKGVDDVNTQLNGERQKNAQLTREFNDLKAQLGSFRVPADQILSHADGVITKLDGIDRVFIDLGKGDGIAPGMTFEVYDRLGIPRATSDNPNEDASLKGKASIQVIQVQPGISECKIVRQSPGLAITEGDPISNLVYDKNVKFNFYVYGNFNLDYKGVATEKDTEIVRRLISGWGGQVGDQLTSKTDFVILGDEPVVPNYTQDQLAREPEKAFEKERAEQALEAYTEVRTKANQLNIPLLNQTRFLYMVGYYDEARR